MTLMALKAAEDLNQAAMNINLGVKAITDVKKSTKATGDVKPLKSTLTRSVDWPNFRTVKMVKLVANFQWCHWPKINFSVALLGQIYRLVDSGFSGWIWWTCSKNWYHFHKRKCRRFAVDCFEEIFRILHIRNKADWISWRIWRSTSTTKSKPIYR